MILVGELGRCSGVRWNNISSLLTFMSPIRVGIIIFPDIASVYVIDVLVLNVTLRIKFYFDIQNVRYTKMAYLILGERIWERSGWKVDDVAPYSLREGS